MRLLPLLGVQMGGCWPTTVLETVLIFMIAPLGISSLHSLCRASMLLLLPMLWYSAGHLMGRMCSSPVQHSVLSCFGNLSNHEKFHQELGATKASARPSAGSSGFSLLSILPQFYRFSNSHHHRRLDRGRSYNYNKIYLDLLTHTSLRTLSGGCSR